VRASARHAPRASSAASRPRLPMLSCGLGEDRLPDPELDRAVSPRHIGPLRYPDRVELDASQRLRPGNTLQMLKDG
jgi:hypothetical protein